MISCSNNRHWIRFVLLLVNTTFWSSLSAQKNLQHYFDDCGYEGSITIFDYNLGKWISNDFRDSHRATLPASTFKIINTLIVLETEAVKDEYELVPWIDDYDTVKYSHRPNIYHAMGIKEAFELSAGWVYRELAKAVGKETYLSFLERITYGNGQIFIDDPDFWNFGDFAVSPVNQIEILKSVYEETIPFSEQSINKLKSMMLMEDNENYKLSAKTGWTSQNGVSIGW